MTTKLDGNCLALDTVSLSRRNKLILDRISCQLYPGEVLGILGANGAGKSTLLNVLSGELPADAGRVLLDGVVIHDMSVGELARRRTVLPQQAGLAFNLAVREVVAMGAYPFPELSARDVASAIKAALQCAEVAHLAERRYPELSGGEQQRVQFARVLVQALIARNPGEARYLLLDEPTASLDPRHQHGLLGAAAMLAKQEQLGVAVVLHDVNLAATYCNRIVLLAAGQLVAQGIPAEVLQSGYLRQTYQLDSQVIAHPQHPERPLVLFA
ncbi:heme ABC transporter ATP-binding protein [Chitinibacter sp. GC72]|uniref:heme ABC transporter ATP-binding protein n=1 Tax=Chitinibacter sp. GC72 TaxID=1526917 RepID=UPI0012FC6D7A|nr:heme ABC transporter ATP-binding protein [Chitinibacter sp. GC72]